MKWRELFESSPLARDAANSGGFVFGEPATESDIALLAQRLGVQFPAEVREVYGEFNGVGLRYSEDQTIWWLTPLEKIEELTASLRESWFDDDESETLASRMVCVGDWFNGDLFGYVADGQTENLSDTLHQYFHEVGRIESLDQSLEQFMETE